MKSPDVIKKALDYCASSDNNCCAPCPYDDFEPCKTVKLMRDALAYIRQLEAVQPKWISVEDRLPEAYDDGSVDAVIVTDGYLIHMAYFICGKWRFCESGEMKEEMFYTVTHWMPLPEPPKDKA